MAVDLHAALEAAREHLRAGAVQAADDLISLTLADYAVEQAELGNAPPAPPPADRDILISFARAITAKLGNPHDLTELLGQLEGSTA